MPTRREILANASTRAATATATRAACQAAPLPGRSWDASYSGERNSAALPPSEPGKDYSPVVTPKGATLPFKVVDGVKVFHLVAEPLWHEFTKGLKARCRGYNGRVHGPTLEASEGDRVRVYVTILQGTEAEYNAIPWAFFCSLKPSGLKFKPAVLGSRCCATIG